MKNSSRGDKQPKEYFFDPDMLSSFDMSECSDGSKNR